MSNDAILFMRLAGPLQAWGESVLNERKTLPVPTKSGVIGIICCCLGMRRDGSFDTSSPYAPSGITMESLNALKLGIRTDRPGMLLRDWHAAGAKAGVMCAEGKLKFTEKTGKPEPVVSNRYYLCEADFLAVLAGPMSVMETVCNALKLPHWPPYLGRKCCPPSVPLLPRNERLEAHGNLLDALASRPWHRHWRESTAESIELDCLIETNDFESATRVEHDGRLSYASWMRLPRHVQACSVHVSVKDHPFAACFGNSKSPKKDDDLWDKKRFQRAVIDNGLCVFCGRPSRDCHHKTYRNYPNNEDVEADLRSLCPLCHQAISQLETLYSMGVDRIDPLEQGFADAIIIKRERILTEHMKPRKGLRSHHDTI